MTLKKHTRYLFNPELRFRRESRRCIGYTIDDFFHTPDNVSVFSPDEVILLLLFDGTRTLAQAEKDFRYLYNIENNCLFSVPKTLDALEKRTRISPLLVPVANYTDAQVRTTVDRYINPEEFLIPQEDIRLEYNDLRLEAPLSVNFNVATTCGFHCKYCYHPLVPVPDLIPLPRLSKLFLELHDLGCESLLLTGGDPMLRPDIDEVMRSLYDAGLFYTLSTKSILSRDRLRWLHDEAGLDRMQLSLDSCNPEVVSSLIGVKGDYMQGFTRMVNDMRRLGMDIRLKAVLTSYNADGIEDFLSYATDMGIRHVQVVAYGRSGTRHSDDLFASDEQTTRASTVLARWKSEHPDMDIVGGNFQSTYDEPISREGLDRSNIFEKRSICNAGRFSMTIMPNGKLYICEHLPYDERYVIGDLRKQGVKECWEGDEVRKWLSPPARDIFPEDSPCRICEDEFYSICHERYSRCLRYILELTGTDNGPDIHCPNAVFKKTRSV